MEQHNQEIGTRQDLVLYRLETARNDLKSARALFSTEDYKGANNRAYYSIFHAINAVHAVSGKAYKRHKDAVANFNKDYVKTSVFPREMGRKIGQQEMRDGVEAKTRWRGMREMERNLDGSEGVSCVGRKRENKC